MIDRETYIERLIAAQVTWDSLAESRWENEQQIETDAKELERLRTFHNTIREQKLRIKQLEEEYQPGLVERRLADELLDALETAAPQES